MKALILAIVGLLATVTAGAQENVKQHLQLGDVDAYYGLVPSADVAAHPASHPEATMHGGVPGNRYSYHLVVALFDHATRKRISNAQVTASVQELGLGTTQKRLQPMRINHTVTYGAYFDLSGAGPYRVKLDVKRPGRSGVDSGQFEYQPPD